MKKIISFIVFQVNKSSNYSPESMKVNDKIYYDKKSISNAFASYFSEISWKVVRDMTPSGKDFKENLSDASINSIYHHHQIVKLITPIINLKVKILIFYDFKQNI